jgi:hypothetical protein
VDVTTVCDVAPLGKTTSNDGRGRRVPKPSGSELPDAEQQQRHAGQHNLLAKRHARKQRHSPSYD